MKMNLHLGSLKPNKVKGHRTTAKVSGHMPVGAAMSFGRKHGKPNHFC